MVRPRQVGPDLPSGLRRPDRSVSLRSEPPLPPMVDPRKAAAATGGAIWVYSGYGNPPQKQMGPNRWGPAESEYQKLADAVQKTAEEEGKSVDSADPEEVMDWLGKGLPVGVAEPIWVEITPEGTVEEVPEPDPADWVPGEVPEVVPEVVPPAVGGPTLLGMQGLTADEAFQQHQATSGVGAMTGAGAMAGMNAMAGREPWPGQQKVPLDVVGEPGLVPPPREPWPGQQKVPLDVMNPEARSMDSQMLTDLMAQQATQPDQGWLGGALGGVGGFLGDTLSQMQGNTTLPYAQQAQGQLNAFQNMSTEQKIAIVLTGLAYAAGTSGVGSPAVPPLLGGAALLNATG